MKIPIVYGAFALLSTTILAAPADPAVLNGGISPRGPPGQREWMFKMNKEERVDLENKSATFGDYQRNMLQKYKPHYCPADKFVQCVKDNKCIYYYSQEPSDALSQKCMEPSEQNRYHLLAKIIEDTQVSLCKKYHPNPSQC